MSKNYCCFFNADGSDCLEKPIYIMYSRFDSKPYDNYVHTCEKHRKEHENIGDDMVQDINLPLPGCEMSFKLCD